MRTPGDEVLFKDKWMELRKKDNWYTYAHNTHGDGVAVLGTRQISGMVRQYLVRVEHTPPHGIGFRYTSLTGSIENGDLPRTTAVRELKEESGFIVSPDELIDLGWVYPSKFSDYKQHLFLVHLDGREQGEIEGDGSKGEEGASVIWMSISAALAVNDPSIGATVARWHWGVK